MRPKHPSTRRTFNHYAALVLAGALLAPAMAITVTGCGQRQSAQGGGSRANAGPQAIPVQVASVQRDRIAATVPVVGDMNALQDVQVSARTTGRVVQVTVLEGDIVHAGQLLVKQDMTDLEANVRQDLAAIQNNLAQVSQAISNLQIQIAQAAANVTQARAALRAAQYNYSKEKQGSRPEQILQAQATVNQAQANVDNAAITLKRNQSLFTQGAIARADLDTARTTYNVDIQQLNNAKAALKLAQAGNYPQDIAAAQEQVSEQQANLSNQIANERQVEVRRDQITAAQALVQQAREKLAFDRQQLAYASIRSPIDGIVAAREIEPGQVASPGTNVVRVVNVRTMYYEPTVSEYDFRQVAIGNSVNVLVDAIPGRIYRGRVAAVYPAASTSGRVFSLRVNVDDPHYELRPGLYARGSIVTQVHNNAVVVPVVALVPVQSALQALSGQGSVGEATGQTSLPPQQVFVVDPNGKATAVPVQLGIVTANAAEVVSGLEPGAQLIVNGQNLVQPGTPVRVIGSPGGGRRVRPASTPSTGRGEGIKA